MAQTAATLDEITATVRKTAEGASEARGVVTAAKDDAERSGTVIRETVTAMDGISDSSKKIGNIIGVIDEIAFQTNLLALNAGVEAARAGDAGRGFAVVATEVRALAQRSADAAKEIKTLISASSQQVATGVSLVGETGRALTRIVDQVNRLNVLVVAIAGSVQEQATGLGEVNSTVNQMDEVTQKNAGMVAETTAASQSLAAEAAELIRLMGQFKLKEPAVQRGGAVAPPRAGEQRGKDTGGRKGQTSRGKARAVVEGYGGWRQLGRILSRGFLRATARGCLGRVATATLTPLVHRHAQLLELAMQSAALHAHEGRRPTDIAAQPHQLRL